MLQNCVWDFIIVTIEHYTEFIEKRTPVHLLKFLKKKIEVDCVLFPAKTIAHFNTIFS